VVAQRSEPKTLNPIFAIDEPSRTVAGLLGAPLVRIHPETLLTEAVLAESWTVTPDGREITVRLRPNLRFSDGTPLTIDDVLFSFALHLDPKVASPQQELLKVAGQPVRIRKDDTNNRTVHFTLAAPYALGERILAGTAIVPKHLLEKPYSEGRLASIWTLNTPPAAIAGAGPFLLKSYQPGQRIVLARNPHYFKKDAAGKPLPYLDEIEFLFTAGEDAQAARFLAGEADLIAGFGGATYKTIESAPAKGTAPQLTDAGPGLDYTFLLFNLNPSAANSWFEQTAFRQAISAAIDRQAVARLVYRNRGSAIWSHVTPARKLWFDDKLPRPAPSLDFARTLLRNAGFTWNANKLLLDRAGTPVTFTTIVNSGNPAYTQTAAIIEEDLKPLGITVRVVPLEFRSLVDRIINRRDFDTAIMALRPGDADPAADMNVLVSSGRTRLWNMSGQSTRDWEASIDRLMREQLTLRDPARRRELFHQVQGLLATQQPFIPLASPNLLIAARPGIGNLRPAALGDLILWNADELFRK
jgi:peptide/nickel transport system substrate-binding protein